MGVLDPQPRSSFLAAPVEPDDNARAIFTLHQMSSNGAIDDKPKIAVTLFHATNIETPQEERVAVLASNADSGKLYLFGRTPRIYSVSGFLVDSDLQASKSRIIEYGGYVYQVQGQGANVDDAEYKGHLLRRWMELYETELRLSKCLKKNRILKFRWRSSEVYGYMLGQVRSMESSTPSLFSLGLTFVSVFEEESIEIPLVRIRDLTVPGMISSENVERATRNMPPAKTTGAKSEMGKQIDGRTRVPPTHDVPVLAG